MSESSGTSGTSGTFGTVIDGKLYIEVHGYFGHTTKNKIPFADTAEFKYLVEHVDVGSIDENNSRSYYRETKMGENTFHAILTSTNDVKKVRIKTRQ